MKLFRHSNCRRPLIAAFAALAAGLTAMYAQVKLPVTVVNGRECFYYKPQNSSETVYGLSKRLGLTREEIVAYNPQAADGIRKNTTLYFPVTDFRDRIDIDTAASDAVVRNIPSVRLKPVDTHFEIDAEPDQDTIVTAVLPEMPSNRLKPIDISYEIDSITTEESPEPVPYTIAVLLPFKLADEELLRPEKMVTDFYKGFLIAADTLSRRGDKVLISTYDISENIDSVLSSTAVKDAAVIVAPDSPGFIGKAIDAEVKGYIVNTLNFTDSLYLKEPHVIQANIPHRTMYAKAIDHLIGSLDGAIPVILNNTEGRNDKEAFTAALRERLAEQGIKYAEIPYEGTLAISDLELLATYGKSYVIIPSAGSISEFNRFSHALNMFRTATPDITLRLFGYPEWVTFRGDAQDMLHTLGATIYSRFNDDYTSFSARNIQDDFIRWYNAPMIESIPSQGLLGYDLGCMLIKNLRANKGIFNPMRPAQYEGIQSTFRFSPAPEDGGYVNDALYIVSYLPVSGTDSKIL